MSWGLNVKPLPAQLVVREPDGRETVIVEDVSVLDLRSPIAARSITQRIEAALIPRGLLA